MILGVLILVLVVTAASSHDLPPVTHSGPLERLYVCKENDIEDWQVTDTAGLRHGAFSQHAMFKIARRDGVKPPKKLPETEKLHL